MAETISGDAVAQALRRVCAALIEQSDYLTSLDQALGDGDMGITMAKLANGLLEYLETASLDDLGKFLLGAGMAANRAAPSTMGTLTATGLMRAGREVKGKSQLSPQDLAAMFQAADQGMQERGKAKPGDKTIIDALHPAAQAFAAAVQEGASLQEAGQRALAAAREGLEKVTPLRSKVGRASWVGERTQGKVDPGCAMFVLVLETLNEGS